MSMTLYEFLHPLGELKELELVSEKLFGIINSSQTDTSEYELTLTDWVFNELTLLNGYKKIQIKLKEKIETNHFIPKETLPFEDFDKMVSWLSFIGFDDEWEIIEDKVLCKLQNDLSIIGNKRITDFYDNKLIQLKINPKILQRNLYTKIQSIEEKDVKEFYNEFLQYLKEIYSELIVGQQIKIEESNNSESNIQSQTESSDESIDEEIIVVNQPFQNLEILNFFLHIKETTLIKNKIFYSYLREFLMVKKMFLDSNMNRENYYRWINKNLNLTDKRIIKYQHNLSNQKQYFDTFESELNYFEKNIKQIPRIE